MRGPVTATLSYVDSLLIMAALKREAASFREVGMDADGLMHEELRCTILQAMWDVGHVPGGHVTSTNASTAPKPTR